MTIISAKENGKMEKQTLGEKVFMLYGEVQDCMTFEEFLKEMIEVGSADIVRRKNKAVLAMIITYACIIFVILSFTSPQLIRNTIVSLAGGVICWPLSTAIRHFAFRSVSGAIEEMAILKDMYRKKYVKPGEKAFWDK